MFNPQLSMVGQSVLLWNCMSAAGVGTIEFIGGIMDKHKYINILKANVSKILEKLQLGDGWIFQQDNDPKYTAILTRELLLYNVPKQLYSPPVARYKPHRTFMGRIKTTFTKKTDNWRMRQEVTHKLVDSMPRKKNAIIKAKEGATKY